MKPRTKKIGCPEGLSSECIIWQGGDIPCLGICNGDTLSETESVIADKICEILEDIDLSSVDISCVNAECQKNCEDKSLKTLIQILFDNQCYLRDLINSSGEITADVELSLNLRCLKKFDDFGNEIEQNLNQTLQSIVNEVCTHKDQITSLQSQINDLQDQIDDLESSTSTPTEPVITTCITPTKPVSQAVTLLATNYCNYKNLIGTESDIQNVIASQCEGLNTLLGTNPNFVLTPENLMDSLVNAWLTICNLKSRIELIENNCCAVTCDDIVIAFNVEPNEFGSGVFIKFDSKTGIKIPNGFTDCGSIITFTDKNGAMFEFPIVVAAGTTQGDFDLAGLDLNESIIIELTTKLCSDTLGCEKCTTRVYTFTDNSCPVCKVTASGTTGNVTITYIDPNQSS